MSSKSPDKCPYCKERIGKGAEICPSCGSGIKWKRMGLFTTAILLGVGAFIGFVMGNTGGAVLGSLLVGIMWVMIKSPVKKK